jgi:suppressor for copper-sensitivity B
MGGSVGWGIHFQQPIFISLMLIIILLFSASLFGLFNLNLPSFIYSKIDKYLSTKVSSLAFFEGVFATLLATPCSAPFLGTAVGLALSSSSYLTLTIFILLGLGMSFPYLLFFIFPKFLNFLPKPGRWMNKLNIILGLSLIFSAIWLLKILLKLTNFNLIFFVLVITSILVFIFSDRKLYRSFFFILSLFIIILPIRFEETITANIINKFYKNDNLIWVEFDKTKIDKYLDQNKIVFVDITADWCITCKVNDILVLDSKKVKNLFNSENVVLMRGDWTHEDKNISSFISNWQRFGIPLNVVYGPSVEKGILFPEILTKNLIEKNVLKAR